MLKAFILGGLLLFSSIGRTAVVDFFIGYIDQKPGILLGNAIVLEKIMIPLLQPCTPPRENVVCGWQLVQSKPVILRKSDALIRFFSSSHTLRDDLNRGTYRNEQQLLSERVDAQYADSLVNSDVVFYVGHSRYGYGPDFFPGILTSADHVNSGYYKNLALQKRDNIQRYFFNHFRVQARVVGFFSCDSDNKLIDRLKRHHPATRFIGTQNPLNPEKAAELALASLRNYFVSN